MAERIRIVPQEQRVREILVESQAIVDNDHFRYSSGRHGKTYINKDALYTNTARINELCRFLARGFQGKNIETIVGPALGGIVLSQSVAGHLSNFDNKPIMSVFAEKDGDDFVFKRGYAAHVTGKNVLVVEDILTTGGSARKTVDLVRETGGNVVGLGVLINRGGVTSEDVGNVPLKELLSVNMDSWTPDECPPCLEGIPINTSLGHAL